MLIIIYKKEKMDDIVAVYCDFFYWAPDYTY